VHLVDTRKWRRRPFCTIVRGEFCSAIGELRERRYDMALDLQGSIKSALLARLSRAGRVLGFRHPQEWLARWLYDETTESSAPHVIDQNRELVRRWLERPAPGGHASAPGAGGGLLPRDESAEASVATTLEGMGLARAPFAILNPGAGWAAKQWPAERYAELAIELASRGIASIVNYGPGEEGLAKDVAEASRVSAVALATDLSQLIALARRAHLFVGGDTGPLHLAALLGVKTVALFGPTDPECNGPYWPTSRTLRDAASITSYSHQRAADPGLELLTVAQVLEEVDSLLG